MCGIVSGEVYCQTKAAVWERTRAYPLDPSVAAVMGAGFAIS